MVWSKLNQFHKEIKENRKNVFLFLNEVVLSKFCISFHIEVKPFFGKVATFYTFVPIKLCKMFFF